jgi:hypothetical protein
MYVVDKVDSLSGIRFSPVNIIQRMLHTYLKVNTFLSEGQAVEA